MSEINLQNVQSALRNINYPGYSRDIMSFGIVRDIGIDDGIIWVKVEVTTSDSTVLKNLKADIEAKLGEVPGAKGVEVSLVVSQPQKKVSSEPIKPEGKPSSLTEVKYAIAISSGKGGVGKSTFAVNLSCALEQILSKKGQKSAVGLMDCDIYGPSVPLMIGAGSRPEAEGGDIIPVENFGVKVMSMGFLLHEDVPVVWRGPMIMKTIQQFSTNVKWGQLDYLLIDLPPGTGDAQLSLVQTIPLDGTLVVTTPQTAAVNVARRGARMFDKVKVPLMGVAENMSYLVDEKSGEKTYIFGEGGGEQAAKDFGTELLGKVPLDMQIRQGCDRGIPIVISDPESACAKVFFQIAERLIEKTLGEKSKTSTKQKVCDGTPA